MAKKKTKSKKSKTKIKALNKSDVRPSVGFNIRIYLDDGRIFKYCVPSVEKIREHASAIVSGGYRHNDGKIFEHYPPHRILKVKSGNIDTNYPDEVEGT